MDSYFSEEKKPTLLLLHIYIHTNYYLTTVHCCTIHNVLKPILKEHSFFEKLMERLLAAKVTSVKLEIYKKPAQSPSQSAPTILVLKTWVGL